MTKAKTASKNNPTTRKQAKESFHQGQKIKPVKLITEKGGSYLAAEYEGSGELVLDVNKMPMHWAVAKDL